jgi:hypothetical protein
LVKCKWAIAAIIRQSGQQGLNVNVIDQGREVGGSVPPPVRAGSLKLPNRGSEVPAYAHEPSGFRLSEISGQPEDWRWWRKCAEQLGSAGVESAIGQFEETSSLRRVENPGAMLTKILKDVAAQMVSQLGKTRTRYSVVAITRCCQTVTNRKEEPVNFRLRAFGRKTVLALSR